MHIVKNRGYKRLYTENKSFSSPHSDNKQWKLGIVSSIFSALILEAHLPPLARAASYQPPLPSAPLCLQRGDQGQEGLSSGRVPVQPPSPFDNLWLTSLEQEEEQLVSL